MLRRDFGLGQRVRIRVDDDDAEDWILIVGSIQLERDPGKRLAIHLNLLGSLRIFTGSVGPPQQLRARQK